MEPLTYIHLAMCYEDSPHTDISSAYPTPKLNLWQMSSTAALVLVIIFGGFTRVVSAVTNPAEIPAQQQSTLM